ncbi:MAG TPA: efflux RND transporter periplasmic adaptor subunit [Vicinamibacterales bacterium]|nr:efflux RND transporter periplasmic adaptor subunit [Vicinamibacterales bacterium]
MFHESNWHLRGVAPAALLLLTLAACGGSGPSAAQGGGGRQGGPPAMGVKITTLSPQKIEDASEFVATIRSLHSTTVQPEVEGKITRIFVKSGDHVRAGEPLVQIDPEKQAATVRSTESTRQAREADVTYWTQQVQRLKALLDAGAISKAEFDQAENSLKTAQAALDALDAQVKEGRVQLQYYTVKAPAAGIVGDMPLRVGDRVITSTMITTIDDNAGLEVYIQVPLDRAPDLRTGLPVELLDADGRVVAADPITFVAPRVDPATQTVLAKALLRNVPSSVKVQQFVRARVVWRTSDGLLVPVVSVVRVSGQYFCFVAESSGQGLVARQHPIEVGPIQGNDYIVTKGLNAGDKIIVSGVQKLADGVPVRPE